MDLAVRNFGSPAHSPGLAAAHLAVGQPGHVSVRSPLRVSFFGGGTDYPEYFERERGAVLGMAITRHVHLGAQRRPAFLEPEIQLSYSRTERVTRVDQIEHRAIRAAFETLGFDDPVDLGILSALPAQTGLGSSGAFMVGLVDLLTRLQGQPRTPMALAREAIRIERTVLGHLCGVQDQLHAAFGGLNCFEFHGSDIIHRPVAAPLSAVNRLTRSMLLVFTGQTRSAPVVLADQIERTVASRLDDELAHAYSLVARGLAILERGDDALVEDFGRLLHESWVLKRRFSSDVTNEHIDGLYARGLSHGALGGKLCGAGGGGFLLFVVPEETQASFRSAFSPGNVLEIECEWRGCRSLES